MSDRVIPRTPFPRSTHLLPLLDLCAEVERRSNRTTASLSASGHRRVGGICTRRWPQVFPPGSSRSTSRRRIPEAGGPRTARAPSGGPTRHNPCRPQHAPNRDAVEAVGSRQVLEYLTVESTDAASVPNHRSPELSSSMANATRVQRIDSPLRDPLRESANDLSLDLRPARRRAPKPCGKPLRTDQ